MVEYIAKLENFLNICGMNEDPIPILSHFRIRPHEDLRKELCMRNVYILEEAYQLMLDFDTFYKPPSQAPPHRLSFLTQP